MISNKDIGFITNLLESADRYVRNKNEAIRALQSTNACRIQFVFPAPANINVDNINEITVYLDIKYSDVIREFVNNPTDYYAKKSKDKQKRDQELKENSKSYTVSIDVVAGENTEFEKRNRWHLDFDPQLDGHRRKHSFFHFHCKHDKDIDSHVLSINEPRIEYPPLDVILAIHFVFNNFMSYDIHEQLKIKVHRYKQMVLSSIETLWIPYFKILKDNFYSTTIII